MANQNGPGDWTVTGRDSEGDPKTLEDANGDGGETRQAGSAFALDVVNSDGESGGTIDVRDFSADSSLLFMVFFLFEATRWEAIASSSVS